MILYDIGIEKLMKSMISWVSMAVELTQPLPTSIQFLIEHLHLAFKQCWPNRYTRSNTVLCVQTVLAKKLN